MRAALEPRFGADFGDVRVHTGVRAAESARDVAAQAYTVGRHTVFAAGRYAPGSAGGQRLLAHELAHVVQQGGAADTAPTEIGRADAPHEHHADQMSRSVLAGGPAPVGRAAPVQLARQPVEDEPQVQETDPDEVHDGDYPNGGPTIGSADGRVLLADNDPPAEKAPAKKPAAEPEKKPEKPWVTSIDVDLSGQTMTVHWSDGTTEAPRPISSGRGRPNTPDDPCKSQTEENCTPVGTFTIGKRGKADYANRAGDPMAWYMEFDGKGAEDRGIGIHNGQPVVKGTPVSHGCVRTGSGKEATDYTKRINLNTRPGETTIVVTGKAPTKPWTKPTKKKAPPKQEAKK